MIPYCIISDLDGTIALVEHRMHYISSAPKDYDAFHAACRNDEPNPPEIRLLQDLHSRKWKVIILTGRSDAVREQTKEWFSKHKVPYDELIMKPDRDHSPTEKWKRKMLHSGTIPHPAEISFVLEDDPEVVAMWRSEGLTCFQVNEGWL